jgi:hypothetical protein
MTYHYLTMPMNHKIHINAVINFDVTVTCFPINTTAAVKKAYCSLPFSLAKNGMSRRSPTKQRHQRIIGIASSRTIPANFY